MEFFKITDEVFDHYTKNNVVIHLLPLVTIHD